VLLEGEREVLRRELALEDAECHDAAQTIALVLERYFDAVEHPPPPDPAPVPGPRTESVVASPHERLAPPRTPNLAEERALPAYAGLAYDWKLGLAPLVGVGLFPASGRLAPNAAIGAALDLAFFVTQQSQTVREQRISASTLRASLYVPLALRFGAWSTWLGPWGQFSLQRAHAQSLAHAREAYRALPGIGGFLRLGWSPARAWTLAAGAAAGAQLTSASSRLVLQRSDGARDAVLVPASWFGQVQLTLGTTL
jgi:hypothetical protein